MIKKIFNVNFVYVKNNKVLMLKEKDIDYLKLPGGKLQEKESEADALRRELFEELGVEIKNIKHFGNFTNKGIDTNLKIRDDWQITLSIYLGEIVGDIFAKEDDIEELKWISLEDTQLLSPATKDLFNALRISGILN